MRRLVSAAVISVALSATGIACSVASASPVWVSKEHTLKTSSETRTVLVKFGKLKVRWEDRTTTNRFEVECKKASGEAELKGGFPGTDQLTSFTFEECSLIKAATKCKLSAGGVNAEELPGWPTELKIPIADAFTGVRFSLALTGCEKGSFNKTWVFKGKLTASIKNESNKIKLTLPTLAGGAEPIETEGDEASLSGSGELEEVGGKLAAEEATARWYNEANERFPEGVRENISIENVGSTVVKTSAEGVEIEISCPVLEGEGWIENKTAGAGFNLALAILKKCTVPKPGGTCKIAKEAFREVSSESSGLIYKGTSIFDELKGGLTNGFFGFKNIAEIKIEGCEKAGLNGTWSVGANSEHETTEKAVGEYSNEKSSIKFTASSGSELYFVKTGAFSGQPVTLTAEDKLELETGGKIQVG
jgi:hypothetical protein